jgi:hypothetical protein
VTEAEAIAAAELVEAETAYRNQLAYEMAEHAAATSYERGAADGYAHAIAEVKAAQHGLVQDAELEIRRWGPGGREAFGNPRPGDFPGRREPEPEPEPELEAEIA